jgi:L-arabinose isomerase
MKNLEKSEIWFVAGSQHLYSQDALSQVASNAQKIAQSLGCESLIPFRVVCKPVMTTPEDIRKLCREANNAEDCIGLILWMHTFSPAKMWIAGLSSLKKPFLHLHTQFNRELPWRSIDMDFMNLNQSAHGDREFGFLTARLRLLSQGSRRFLAGPGDGCRDRDLDSRRCGMA